MAQEVSGEETREEIAPVVAGLVAADLVEDQVEDQAATIQVADVQREKNTEATGQVGLSRTGAGPELRLNHKSGTFPFLRGSAQCLPASWP